MLVASTLGLHRNDELASISVDSYIDFIDFDLSDTRDGRAQMILQRVSGHPEKNIDQAIVTDFREQGLFVGLRVGGDDFWCGVGNFESYQIVSGSDAVDLGLSESISRPTCPFDDPFETLVRRCPNRVG